MQTTADSSHLYQVGVTMGQPLTNVLQGAESAGVGVQGADVRDQELCDVCLEVTCAARINYL